MSSSDKAKLVHVVANETKDDPIAEHARRIAELATAMDEPNVFQKGQLVRWKAGLKNRILPAYNEPVIVREVLAQPLFDGARQHGVQEAPFLANH